jgi:hypothetical protein
MFDELPALSAPASLELCDELEHYLSVNPEHVNDVCTWWYKRWEAYPFLHCMALNYHTIPGVFVAFNFRCATNLFFLSATLVNIKHVFSQGHIVLSHLQSCLSVQLTQALMCIGAWSCLRFVEDNNIMDVVIQPEVSVNGKEE